MSEITGISWTDATWNIARGCRKVDADCKFCYMYRDSFDGTRYNPRQIIQTKGVFGMPKKFNRPSECWPGRPLIFTCSLTDFFIEEIDEFRHEAWDIIRSRPDIIFQILTKRPERIKQCLPADWGEGWGNVWLGTSCGSQESTQRIIKLLEVPAKLHFLSLEPLHGEIDLTRVKESDGGGTTWVNNVLAGTCREYNINKIPMLQEEYEIRKIGWVIVGGESGNETGKYRYRPADLSWFKKIIFDCHESYVPCFVKQLGTHLAKTYSLKSRHGSDPAEWTEKSIFASLRRQFPASEFH